MTTLYKPVLIESTEQAAALPIGTLAAPMYEDGPDFVHALVRREGTYEPWCDSDGSHARGHGDLDGFVTLVPIEAEEEWTPMVNGHAYVNGKKSEAYVRAAVAEWPGAATGHRLVTPWEAV